MKLITMSEVLMIIYTIWYFITLAGADTRMVAGLLRNYVDLTEPISERTVDVGVHSHLSPDTSRSDVSLAASDLLPIHEIRPLRRDSWAAAAPAGALAPSCSLEAVVVDAACREATCASRSST